MKGVAPPALPPSLLAGMVHVALRARGIVGPLGSVRGSY